MFQKIFNPITKKWVFINSKKGKEILKLHLYFLKLKGGESLYDMIIDKNNNNTNTTTIPPLDINLLNFC